MAEASVIKTAQLNVSKGTVTKGNVNIWERHRVEIVVQSANSITIMTEEFDRYNIYGI